MFGISLGSNLNRIELAGKVGLRAQPDVAAGLLVADDHDRAGRDRLLQVLAARRRAIAVGGRSGRCRGVVKRHPRVNRHQAVRIKHHRVEVHLPDLGPRVSQLTELHQQIDKCVHINGPHPAHAAQKGRAFEFIYHLPAGLGVDRRRPHHHVLENLDQHAAQPGHQHRAEGLVVSYPGQHLDSRGRHRLHRHAFKARGGRVAGELVFDLLESGFDLRPRRQPQHDSTDVALMGHLGREHL